MSKSCCNHYSLNLLKINDIDLRTVRINSILYYNIIIIILKHYQKPNRKVRLHLFSHGSTSIVLLVFITLIFLLLDHKSSTPFSTLLRISAYTLHTYLVDVRTQQDINNAIKKKETTLSADVLNESTANDF